MKFPALGGKVINDRINTILSGLLLLIQSHIVHAFLPIMLVLPPMIVLLLYKCSDGQNYV